MSQNKRFQGALSNNYDLFKLVSAHEDEIQETIERAIRKHFANKEQESIQVLELGSGTGLTTSVILNSDARTIVTAVDNEESMVRQIKEKLKNEVEKGRVIPIQEDCLEYLKKVKEDSFDVLATAWTLHNFDKDYREKVLKEIYRILEKGGLFVNADKYAFDDPVKQKKESAWNVKKFDDFEKMGKPELKEEWTKHYRDDEKPEVIMFESKSKEQMEKIGFINIETIYRKHINATIKAVKSEQA